jgi:hypothetical protein
MGKCFTGVAMKVKRYKAFRTVLCKMSYINNTQNGRQKYEYPVFEADLMISSYGRVYAHIGAEIYEYDDATKMLETWDVVDRRVLVEKTGLLI